MPAENTIYVIEPDCDYNKYSYSYPIIGADETYYFTEDGQMISKSRCNTFISCNGKYFFTTLEDVRRYHALQEILERIKRLKV